MKVVAADGVKSYGVYFVRLLLFLVILWSVMPPGLPAAEEYSLDDLYRIALDRSEQIRISEEDVYVAERGKDKAFSAFLPRAVAFGTYTKFDQERISITGSLVQADSTLNMGVRLDETLSLGGRELTAYRMSKEDIRRSKYDFYSVREAYLFSVSSAYYDVLRAKKALEIARANVERLTKYRDAAAVRVKVGEVTKTDLLRAEAELSGAQSELVRADNNLKLMKAVLGRVAGITGSFELRETGVKDNSIVDFALDELKGRALEERSEVKSFTSQKKIADDQVRLVRAAYWPTATLAGAFTRQETDSSVDTPNTNSFSGIVSVNFPFFEGGLRRAEVREAEARYRQAELALEDLKKSIAIEVEAAYLDYMTQKGVLKSLEDQVVFARDNYNSITKQYAFGLTTSIDVIDSNTLLLTAERQRADAEYNYRLSILKIERASGTLLKTVVSQQSGS